MEHLGDITKISGYTAPVVDCIIGGSPCQDLSVAGKRAGLDGERSGLYMEQIRIVKEMRERDERNGRSGVDIRPRYMVWENVPGAFSSNKGEDFRIVLEEIAKVAHKDAVIPPPPNGKWTSCGCIVGDGWSIAWRVLDAQFWGTSDKPLPQRRRRIALVADFGGQSALEILFVRKSVSGDIEPCEPKRKATPSNASRGIGADDCIGVDIYNTALTGDKVCPLTAGGTTSTGTCPKVMTPVTFEPGIASREGGHIYEEVSGTLRANAGDNQMATAYSVENHPNDSRVGINEDGKVQALTSRMDDPMKICIVGTRYIVRRLTPLECERLQGYPDGWTDIGEYIDSNGKKRQTSDAARYKALGNSIALPPWKWVLKRLCACYERDATMASLFDGIGGFPYLWEQLNGKGTCLWASEIEEFPIAVTKVRFSNDKTHNQMQ